METEIQRFANTVKAEAAQRLPLATPAQVLEEAILTTLEFDNISNQTALYLLREMEITQGYRELGYDSLREWAYTRLEPVKAHDTVQRLCGVTLELVAPLDAIPVITPDGVKITGLSIIENASPTASMKLYGMFAHAENGNRERIASELMTGSSNFERIKGRVSSEPRIGRAAATFTDLIDENGEALVDIHIHATYSQSKVIEKSLAWMLTIQFTPLEVTP